MTTQQFRPNRNVLKALRTVRSQGVARRLGKISPELLERFIEGASLINGQADHGYIDDVAVHWRRAGFGMTEEDKNTSYTRDLKQNVNIAKISDEKGNILSTYQNSTLEQAVSQWTNILEEYAHDLSLTRINVMEATGQVPEHIDPPDQNMIQCLLKGETEFSFRTKDGIKTYNMGVGEIWWFNTTWPHSTCNLSNEKRLLLHTRGTIKRDLLLNTPETEPLSTRKAI